MNVCVCVMQVVACTKVAPCTAAAALTPSWQKGRLAGRKAGGARGGGGCVCVTLSSLSISCRPLEPISGVACQASSPPGRTGRLFVEGGIDILLGFYRVGFCRYADAYLHARCSLIGTLKRDVELCCIIPFISTIFFLPLRLPPDIIQCLRTGEGNAHYLCRFYTVNLSFLSSHLLIYLIFFRMIFFIYFYHLYPLTTLFVDCFIPLFIYI